MVYFSTSYEEWNYHNLTMVYQEFIINSANIDWTLAQWLDSQEAIISNVYATIYNNQWQGKKLNDSVIFICQTIFL